jgi:hypothetical protein
MTWFDILKDEDESDESYRDYRQTLSRSPLSPEEIKVREIESRMRKLENMSFSYSSSVKERNPNNKALQEAKREYRNLKRQLSEINKETKRRRKEQRLALIPINQEIKRIKNELLNKKEVVIQEFLKYVDSFGADNNIPLYKITDLGKTTAKGRVFRKVYETAAKESGIYGFSKKINYENYEDFNVDKMVNDFRNALEKAKETYKDEIKELHMSRIRNR